MLTGTALGAAIEAARKKKGVSKKALGEAFGVQPPSVQDWVNRGTIDKEKLPGLWRYFSDVVGPEHWGLEHWIQPQHPSEGTHSGPLVAHDLSLPRLQTAPVKSREVPVIGTLHMGVSNELELRASPDGVAIGHVQAYTAAPGSFALRVVGDHLYPAVRHGACIVIEPDGACVAGELVLIEMAEGHFVISELVAERDDSIIVLPVQGGQRRALPREQVTRMQPIASVVAGSKFTPHSTP